MDPDTCTPRSPAHGWLLCHPGAVLSSLRDRDGGPKVRVRLLALVVALLLAGPLTLLLLRAAARVLDLAL